MSQNQTDSKPPSVEEPREEGLDETPCCASLPEHHVRYARAWALHRDADMPDSAREILEHEMDCAQNLFGWDEFQEFKVTLLGFVEFWADWKSEFLSSRNKEISGGIPSAASSCSPSNLA